MPYNVFSVVEKRDIMELDAVQDFLEQIDGIESCKVIGNDNEILEIHVLSNNLRSPKQLARDIETAILTKFNLRIDRKIISIVQFKGAGSGVASRIKYESVSTLSQNSSVEVEVKLLYDEREYSSKLVGINTAANKNRLVAEATLKDVEEILGQAFIIYPNDVIVKEVSNYTVATVVVTLKVSYIEEVLAGSAIVRNDLNESIVRATLDAINRRIKGIRL